VPVSAADLSADELTAFVKARLVISGFDLSLLPTTFDPATGVPTQDSLVASLVAFVRSAPGALNTWRPDSGRAEQDLYQQQVAPPLLYPSVAEAWTGKVAG